jgi:segregation and condensation protein A
MTEVLATPVTEAAGRSATPPADPPAAPSGATAAEAVPPVAEGPFVVRLDGFAGPLDLLLHLLREERIDIADIPVARIADQFLRAIHQIGINEAADYLEMAGRLLRLKVQMLLPRSPDDEGWEDPRAELVRRLLEYQQVKEIALWMGRSAEGRADQWARGWLPAAPDVAPPPLTLDLLELLAAVERVVAGIPDPVLHRVVARPLDVEGATFRIRTLLEGRRTITWREALGPNPTIVDFLSTLLALLELARRGELALTQPAPFAPPEISRDAALPAD